MSEVALKDFSDDYLKDMINSVYELIPEKSDKKETKWLESKKQHMESVLTKYRVPILELNQREKINLYNTTNDFMVKYVELRKLIDNIHRYNYYPKPERLQNEINILTEYSNEFKKISYDLIPLESETLTVLLTEKEINPFLFTIPFEDNPLIIDQEQVKNCLRQYLDQITTESFDKYIFLIGDGGSGKTHLIKYFIEPLCSKEQTGFLYVKCTPGIDLIKSIMGPLVLSPNMPEEIRNELAKDAQARICTPKDCVSYFEGIAKVYRKIGFKNLIICIDELESYCQVCVVKNEILHYKMNH